MHKKLLVFAGAALIALAAGQAQAQSTVADAPVCNPVIDSNGAPVVSGLAGVVVIHAGSYACPAAARPADAKPVAQPEKRLVISSDVLFDFDKATIKPQFKPELNKIAAELARSGARTVIVVGHTDSVGTDAYNQRLSERRAKAVATYLADAGVPKANLSVDGRGEKEPRASNQSKDGRAQNRRVEIISR